MRYENSQFRFAESIANTINPYIADGIPFVQLYCNRAHVGLQVDAKEKIFLGTDTGMIDLWNKIKLGWVPPLMIDSDTYHFMKRHKEGMQPFFEAFVGRAVSINGKLWGYYDHKRNSSKKRNLAVEAFRSLRKDIEDLERTTDSYSFAVGTMRNLDLKNRYTIYVDVPQEESVRSQIYDTISRTKDNWIWIVAEPEKPPITFYRVWQFDSVSPVDNIFLMSSTKELKK